VEEERPEDYPKLKNYTPTRFMLPTSRYDSAKADRAVMFIENLKHTKGKWAGRQFWLLPWQERIVRDIFDIVKADGKRQFHTAVVCIVLNRYELSIKEFSKRNIYCQFAARGDGFFGC